MLFSLSTKIYLCYHTEVWRFLYPQIQISACTKTIFLSWTTAMRHSLLFWTLWTKNQGQAFPLKPHAVKRKPPIPRWPSWRTVSKNWNANWLPKNPPLPKPQSLPQAMLHRCPTSHRGYSTWTSTSSPKNLHQRIPHRKIQSASKPAKSLTLKDIGLSESSDDDNEYAPSLSKAGRELKRKLKIREEEEKTAKRTYRDPSPEAPIVRKTAFAPFTAPSPASQDVTKKEDTQKKPAVAEKCQFSGYKILNPMIGAADLVGRIGDRRTCKLSQIVTSGLPFGKMDWVTFGVMVTKLPSRTGKSGKEFSMWKVMDLDDCAHLVTIFLFGDAHTDCWRVQAGNAIALLNRSTLPKKDDRAGLSLSVASASQIIELGYAADLGYCKGQTKSDQSCKNLVNKTKCEYCVHHLKAAFQKASSQRMDIQTNFSGVQPRLKGKKIAEVADGFFYGGKTFVAGKVDKEVKKGVQQVKTPISREAQALIDESRQLIRKQLNEAEKVTLERVTKGNEELNELVVKDGPGARNLVKSITLEGSKKQPRKYVSPTELLKNNEMSIKKLIENHKKRILAKDGPERRLGGSAGEERVVFMDNVRGAKGHPLRAPAIPASQARAIARLQQTGKAIPKPDPNRMSQTASASPRLQTLVSRARNTEVRICNLQDDPEIQALLTQTSRHDDLCKLDEMEFMDQYFNQATVKEGIETQMEETKEMECDVVVCQKCDYTAISLSKRCLDERHPFRKQKATRRFVKCRKCSKRKPTFKAITAAVSPCKSCGIQNYQWCGMLPYERKGPTLEGEQLLIRGEEQSRFLNSLA